MQNYKYIVTHNLGNSEFGNAYLIMNCDSRSLVDYKRMHEIALMDFPSLKEWETKCLTVVHSKWCKGFMVLKFACAPHASVEGWENVENLPDIIIG